MAASNTTDAVDRRVRDAVKHHCLRIGRRVDASLAVETMRAWHSYCEAHRRPEIVVLPDRHAADIWVRMDRGLYRPGAAEEVASLVVRLSGHDFPPILCSLVLRAEVAFKDVRRGCSPERPTLVFDRVPLGVVTEAVTILNDRLTDLRLA